jgi:hypothetical protein
LVLRSLTCRVWAEGKFASLKDLRNEESSHFGLSKDLLVLRIFLFGQETENLVDIVEEFTE